MRILTSAMAASLVLVAAGPASAADLTVTTSGRTFSPARATVLVGDTVHWRNTDGTTHNVSGRDLQSGNLAPGEGFSQRMDRPGSYPYICTLHRFMSGKVDVAGVLLEASAAEVLSGSSVELTGPAPAGTAMVSIERVRSATGEPVATTQPLPDGTFKVTLTPSETSRYRAVTGAVVSSEVEVGVAAGFAVGIEVARGERFDRVIAIARPAPRSGFTAVLQLYSRERFAWRVAGRRELDRAGRAGFRLRSGIRRLARVVLRSAADPEVAVSASVRLWRPGGERHSKPVGPGTPRGGSERHAPDH